MKTDSGNWIRPGSFYCTRTSFYYKFWKKLNSKNNIFLYCTVETAFLFQSGNNENKYGRRPKTNYVKIYVNKPLR